MWSQGWRKSLASWMPWLWVIWVVVLLVLLWMASDTGGTPTAAAETSGPAGAGRTPTVSRLALVDFGAFVVERNALRNPDGTSAYTSEGIRKLADALADVTRDGAAEDGRARGQIEEVRASAALVQGGVWPETQGRLVREAFVTATEVMTRMQASRYPHLDRAMSETREAARRIRHDRPLPEQNDAIQRFFERSHDMLRAMTAAQ